MTAQKCAVIGGFMYKLRLGRSISFDTIFEERISAAEKCGFDNFDFDLTPNWLYREKEIEQYKLLDEGIKRIGRSPLKLNGVHISFGINWEYSDLNEENRRAAVLRTKEIFEKVDTCNPYCYIVHGSWEPISDDERAKRISAMKRSLTELRSLTKTKICLENLPRTCLCNTSDELREVIDSLDGIDVCLDSNHFLKEKPEHAVENLAGRIKTLHISDYDFVDERHWLPGKGKIDWNAFIGALEKIGYNGVFNYETAASAEEIKENYLKLFSDYNK